MKALKKAPSWIKIAIVLIMIIGVVLTVVKLKDVKKTIETKRSIREYESERQTWENKGEQPSLQSFNYKQMATDIWNACDQWGTDEGLITSTFAKLRNNVDFISLQEAYGIDDDGMTLQQQLKDELGPSDIQAINDTLRIKGIAYSI